MIKITQPQQQQLEAIAKADGDGSAIEVSEPVLRALLSKKLLIVTPTTDGGRRFVVTTEGRSLLPVDGDLGATADDESASNPAEAAPATPADIREPKGKIGDMINLLRRHEGATVAELMSATAWQAHSVRGAISGTLKKKLGLQVCSERVGEVRTYRIVDGVEA